MRDAFVTRFLGIFNCENANLSMKIYLIYDACFVIIVKSIFDTRMNNRETLERIIAVIKRRRQVRSEEAGIYRCVDGKKVFYLGDLDFERLAKPVFDRAEVRPAISGPCTSLRSWFISGTALATFETLRSALLCPFVYVAAPRCFFPRALSGVKS